MISDKVNDKFKDHNMYITPHLAVTRRRGLGNIICLLPILDRLYNDGYQITVNTRTEWIHAFSVLRPDFFWNDTNDNNSINLDEITTNLAPVEHRTDEFARMLGLGRPFPSPRITTPSVWAKPFENLKGYVVFAPESGHPSRSWPTNQAAQLHNHLNNQKLVLVGINPHPDIPCDCDLGGKLQLHELFGLLAIADTVVTMDSAVLHIAAAMNIPTVALFGGVNPDFRIRPDQHVIALQAQIECCPCNKIETCHAEYNCIHTADPEDVANAVKIAKNTKHRLIYDLNYSPTHQYSTLTI